MAEVYCLYCLKNFPSADSRHGCAFNHSWPGYVAVKDLEAHEKAIEGHALYKVQNFNPSCRKVAFDVTVDASDLEILVIVRCKVEYSRGQDQPNWNSDKKKEFLKALQHVPGLWDGHHKLVHTNGNQSVTYTPVFFIDTAATDQTKQYTLNAVTAPEPVILPSGQVTVQCNAFVPLGSGYAQNATPGAGTRHQLAMGVSQTAPRLFPENTNQQNGPVMNAMAHEYAHMIGIPDEYIELKGSWNECGDDKDKAAYLWSVALQNENIPVPQNTGPSNPDLNVMNLNLESRPAGFKKRHYVTVLEAARQASAAHQELGGTCTPA